MDDARVKRFAEDAFRANGVAMASLEPGSTVVVCTRNSKYRVVTQVDPRLVLVQGGAMFPAATLARFQGATGGGSAVRM